MSNSNRARLIAVPLLLLIWLKCLVEVTWRQPDLIRSVCVSIWQIVFVWENGLLSPKSPILPCSTILTMMSCHLHPSFTQVWEYKHAVCINSTKQHQHWKHPLLGNCLFWSLALILHDLIAMNATRLLPSCVYKLWHISCALLVWNLYSMWIAEDKSKLQNIT